MLAQIVRSQTTVSQLRQLLTATVGTPHRRQSSSLNAANSSASPNCLRRRAQISAHPAIRGCSTHLRRASSSYASSTDPPIRLAHLVLDSVDVRSSQDQLADLHPSSAEYALRAKELRERTTLAGVWTAWKDYDQQIRSAEALLSNEADVDMKALAQEEISTLAVAQDECRDRLIQAMFPEDPVHASGAIIELRNAIGGAESSMFVAEMTRMYQRLCSAQSGWSLQTLSTTEPEVAATAGASGLREAILQVDGRGAYGQLRFEAGIHRVQRSPVTTKSAKLQSSTIAIVVLPFDPTASDKAADDVVDPKDVKTEVMRSRGAGGQHVNKTESAIRLTHLPTGVTVSMQDSRSQSENRVKAWAILRGRLMDMKVKQDEESARTARGDQIGGMIRGDKIRTYNFPQDRVTDHRLQMSLSGLNAFMEGEDDGGLWTLVEALQEKEREAVVDARLREAAKGASEGAGR